MSTFILLVQYRKTLLFAASVSDCCGKLLQVVVAASCLTKIEYHIIIIHIERSDC